MNIRLSILIIAPLLIIFSCGDRKDDLAERFGIEGDLGESATGILAKSSALVSSFTSDDSGYVLEANRTPEENIKLISNAIKASANNNTCAKVTVEQGKASLSADFSDDCPIKSAGVAISGSISATASNNGNDIEIVFIFTELSIDGMPSVSGSVSVSYSGGNTASIKLSLEKEEVKFTFEGKISYSNQAINLDGKGSYEKSEREFSLTVVALVWVIGDCYPSAGTITITLGRTSEQLTFDENTPQTGEAELSVGRKTETIELKSYGNCPPSA